MNILFLTAATGGGHLKAANALMQQMERQIADCRTLLVDSLKYINPLVDKLVTGTYLRTIRTVPGIYGRFYDMTERDEHLTELVKRFNRLLSHKLFRLILSCKPDAVVCVHTMPLQMLSFLKENGLINVPVIGIVTDFTHHTFWKLDGADAFVVAHDSIKKNMVAMGIREDRVHACGIPVSDRFLAKTDRRRVLEQMGLELKPTVLLMGGSLGFGGLEKAFASLLNFQRELQIIAVTGHNRKLKYRLEELANKPEWTGIPGNMLPDNGIRIFGYSDKINELMDAADVLITKPGGITVSEALVKKLPLLITSPIPGQELRNARFLVDAGAAVRLEPNGRTDLLLENLIGRPAVLKRMSEAAGKLAMPHACEDITALVEALVTKKSPLFCINEN